MAASNAQRQKTFRERIKQRLAMVETAPPLPDKPKISVPANKRWATLADQARAALETRRNEMQEYFDERSEAWRESEKGNAFQERIEALESILDELGSIDD